jgi:hypothetical protein
MRTIINQLRDEANATADSTPSKIAVMREAADLISEMLVALKLIIADRDDTEAVFAGRPIPIRNSSIDAARAAIARAEGRS